MHEFSQFRPTLLAFLACSAWVSCSADGGESSPTGGGAATGDGDASLLGDGDAASGGGTGGGGGVGTGDGDGDGVAGPGNGGTLMGLGDGDGDTLVGLGDGDGDQAVDPLAGAVAFSVPSQTFLGSLEVSMSGATEIRFTTDGSPVTESSPLWDGAPLVLTETTQLRAGAFEAGVMNGTPATALYIRRTFEASSDLPIIVMEGYGAGKPENKEDWVDLGLMVFEPAPGAMVALADLPTQVTRAGYHLRGQSSQNFAKTPYRVELWDHLDADLDQPLLGMPAESDWAFVGPCSDRTLVRNAFIYSLASEMNLKAMELRFAEVYINQDATPLEPEDYEGVYAITETIKNQSDRIDLKQLREDDTMLPDITGGYIFKFDQAAIDDGEAEIPCVGTTSCFGDLELVDPEPHNQQQMDWISGHVSQLNDLLHATPIGDYAAMVDMPSWVDHFLINEMTMDVDAYIRSHVMHKERDGLIHAGPVWDYNFAMGNVAEEYEGWQYIEGRDGSHDWHRILGPDPAFHAALVTRYQELRPGLLSDAELHARIDTLVAPLLAAAERDLARWPVGGECAIGAFFGMTYDPGPPTYSEQIQALKDWISARMAWLDANMN